MRKLHLHPIGLGLIVFGILSWIVALGGLAATTQFCRTQDAPNITYVDGNTTRSLDASITCAQQYQLEWWSIWFNFILLVIMLGTAFVNAFDRARFIYLVYLSLVTVLLTQSATTFCTSSYNSFHGSINFKDQKQSALNAAAAGLILMCIANYALIIFVGLGAAAVQMGGLHLSGPEAKYSANPSNF